jgi:hypothetical protein
MHIVRHGEARQRRSNPFFLSRAKRNCFAGARDDGEALNNEPDVSVHMKSNSHEEIVTFRRRAAHRPKSAVVGRRVLAEP